MDTKFQTSFIPRKTVTKTANFRAEPVSLFLLISIIIFILTLASAGAVFVYKRMLIGSIADMDARLSQAKNSFEPSFISTANRLNQRIEAAKKILLAHTVVTPVFDFLANDTLATVRFNDFSYSLDDNGTATLSLSGEAKSFDSVALQSDVFGGEKFILSPVFSDLNPSQNGNIVFKFVGNLDPAFISYKKNLQLNQSAAAPQGTATAPISNVPPSSQTP
ncbi:hypothetical protein KGQ31_01440 [Patescibacteria group bacterium]|nr:hypothetical protein [Patescibacteria group bacterium]